MHQIGDKMQQMAGYLFVHFTGEGENGEQIYFSLSRDGLHWEDLNHGEPVLTSTTGECGARDPFIMRSVDNKKFYMIATDLRIASGKGWSVAQYEGSRDLLVWESQDLVHWTKEAAVTVGVEGAGCVWAPEAIYDRKNDDYLVFWASMTKEAKEAEAKQKIYYAKTKDFRTFSPTVKYIERENHIIDTSIIEEQGVYYRISKDETTKNIRIDSCDDLINGPFFPISAPVLEALHGVEGPTAFRFYDTGEWCLMVDQYATGKGYLPLTTQSWASGEFEIMDSTDYDMGKTKKRHGSILLITDDEYQNLLLAYGD